MVQKKTTKTAPQRVPERAHVSGPVIITMPNEVQDRMAAIVSMAKAVETLAYALRNASARVEICDCTFLSDGSNPALSIKQ